MGVGVTEVAVDTVEFEEVVMEYGPFWSLANCPATGSSARPLPSASSGWGHQTGTIAEIEKTYNSRSSVGTTITSTHDPPLVEFLLLRTFQQRSANKQ